MKREFSFHTNTALSVALIKLLDKLEQHLKLPCPVNVYLAGGMAVHLYTGSRVTGDVDAEFGRKISLPRDLMVEVSLEDGKKHLVYLDTNYNSSFALMHEDYQDDAIPLDIGLDRLQLRILSPVDLVVSKIARFAINDQEDIEALIKLGLTNSIEIEKRASYALEAYIGNLNMLKINLRDTLDIARRLEANNPLLSAKVSLKSDDKTKQKL